MANLNESDSWEAGIYQLEEDDPVLGGPTGIDNLAPRQLANRSLYQRLRNVTPWLATLDYPANLAFVSHAGTTWKSVDASTAVEPGTDETKWTRWAHTQAEMEALLSESAVRFDEAQALTEPQKLLARTNIGADKEGAAVATVQTNSPTYGVDTGVANACVVAYTPAILELTDGMLLYFKAAASNTGASTLNVNGLGAKDLVGSGAHAALQGGEIVAGGTCAVVYRTTMGAFALLFCTGAAFQVGAATQSAHAMQLGQATGRWLNTQVKTATGIYTPTPGTKKIRVRAVGGGGAGGGTPITNASTVSAGSGGGAGAYAEAIYTADFTGVTVTIGAAGAGVAGSNGGAGGATSFGALLTAPGGGGGVQFSGATAAYCSVSPQSASGSAPSGSGITYSTEGQPGGVSFVYAGGASSGQISGQGGPSALGGGGGRNIYDGVGQAASGRGAGGGGAATGAGNGVARAGGVGTAGLVIIEEFA